MSKIKRPNVKGPLPGPKSKEIIDQDKAYVSPSYTRDFPLVVDHGKGCWVTDSDGNEFLDFSSGIAVTSTGHCHPEVVKAIKDQADKLLHMSGTDFYYPTQSKLAKKLLIAHLVIVKKWCFSAIQEQRLLKVLLNWLEVILKRKKFLLSLAHFMVAHMELCL